MIGTRDASKAELVAFGKKIKLRSELLKKLQNGANYWLYVQKVQVLKMRLTLAGKQNLAGKIIIDITNPITDTPPQDGVLNFTTTFSYSLMEKLQDTFPESKFIKAFNSVGAAIMYKPIIKA